MCKTKGIGGSRGCRQGRAPLLGPNYFIFMQFSVKTWPINRLAPPPWKLVPPPVWEILDPPLKGKLLLGFLLLFIEVAHPWFHRRGWGHQTIIWPNFSHNLHENERNWTQKGACDSGVLCNNYSSLRMRVPSATRGLLHNDKTQPCKLSRDKAVSTNSQNFSLWGESQSLDSRWLIFSLVEAIVKN